MEVCNDARIAAGRCLDAAAGYLERGDEVTTGALLRAAARYIERMKGDGADSRLGEVVKLPAPTRFRGGSFEVRVLER